MNENEEFEFRLRMEQEQESQKQTQNPKEPLLNNVAMGGAMGIPMGASKEDVIPMAFGALSGATLGLPRAMLENPKELATGGIVGAQIAQGANSTQAIMNHPAIQQTPFLRDFLQRNFEANPGRMYGKEVEALRPKTVSGAVAQTLLETLTPVPEVGMLGGFKAFNAPEELNLLRDKGLKAAEELMVPNRNRSALNIRRGRVLPEVESALQNIKKTNSMENQTKLFTKAKDENTDAVQILVNQNNRPVSKEYLGRAEAFYNKSVKDKVLDDTTLAQMKERLDMEKAFIKENENSFDAVAAHERKKLIQSQTEGVLRAKSQDKNIAAKPGWDLMADEIRRGLKDTVESVHPEIKILNSNHEGLLKGEELASLLAADERVAPSKLWDRVVYALGRPSKQSIAAAAIREIPGVTKNVSKSTGDIESIRNRMDLIAEYLASGNRAKITKLLGETKSTSLVPVGERGLATRMERPVKQYQPQLEAPASRKMIGSRNQGAKQLPAPEKFERITKEESAARLREQTHKRFKPSKTTRKMTATEQAIDRLINKR